MRLSICHEEPRLMHIFVDELLEDGECYLAGGGTKGFLTSVRENNSIVYLQFDYFGYCTVSVVS